MRPPSPPCSSPPRRSSPRNRSEATPRSLATPAGGWTSEECSSSRPDRSDAFAGRGRSYCQNGMRRRTRGSAMTSTEKPEDHNQHAAVDGPGDIPGERPAALDRLNVLVGQWETEATFAAGFFGPGSPEVTGRGRTTFHWLDGRYFLTQH